MADTLHGWERRDKPPTLFRRFAFERYAQTRAFLDALLESGRARELDDALVPFTAEPLRETARVAQDIRHRLALTP